MTASTAESVIAALKKIVTTSPQASVLICGWLDLPGALLREND